MTDPKRLLTAKQACVALGEISEQTLRRMVKRGCPRIELGPNTFRYDLCAVLAWSARKPKRPVQPQRPAAPRKRGRKSADVDKFDLSAYCVGVEGR